MSTPIVLTVKTAYQFLYNIQNYTVAFEEMKNSPRFFFFF